MLRVGTWFDGMCAVKDSNRYAVLCYHKLRVGSLRGTEKPVCATTTNERREQTQNMKNLIAVILITMAALGSGCAIFDAIKAQLKGLVKATETAVQGDTGTNAPAKK